MNICSSSYYSKKILYLFYTTILHHYMFFIVKCFGYFRKKRNPDRYVKFDLDWIRSAFESFWQVYHVVNNIYKGIYNGIFIRNNYMFRKTNETNSKLRCSL